ncbi:MAG: PA14 domain-containing protein, partial [Bacteroidota bacterium]
SNFLDRMGKHYSRLDELKINYFWPKVKGLTNNKVFIENIIVELVPGKFGSELYYTIDGNDPTKNSPLYKTPISLTETTLLKVREYSYDGNYSKVYKANYIKESLRKPISIKAQKKGLKYLYFEPTQQIKSTIELENLKPTKKGEIENIVFPLKDDLLPEQFGMIYKGYIEIPSDGVYTFSLLSNDGSHLYVGDKLVVDNDGLHGAYEKDGEIALQKGLHKIKVLYFQAGGGKELKVAIKSNNLERTEISKDILSH